MDYSSKLREAFEQKAKPDALLTEVIKAGLAECDAKVMAPVDRAKELEARRARRRGTVSKRFLDVLGRMTGGAFDIGRKIVKFANEDRPPGVVEFEPDLIQESAKASIEKLKGELWTKGVQKAFEILAEMRSNLAAWGKAGVVRVSSLS